MSELRGARWDRESDTLLINLSGSPDILYAEIYCRGWQIVFRRHFGPSPANPVPLKMSASKEERQQHGSDVLVLGANGALVLMKYLPRLIATARMTRTRSPRG